MRFIKILFIILIPVIVLVTIVASKLGHTQKTFKQQKIHKNISINILKNPTIESVFSNNHSWIATVSADHIRILTATGDIIPARSVNSGVLRRHNPLWPYEKVAPIMQSWKSDITFINLESPLIPDCPATDEGMVFCGDQKNIQGLKSIGVTVANLANNHAGNHGEPGVDSTMNLLQQNGITPTGIHGAVYKNIRGVKFAFLGYNDITKTQPGIENVDEKTMKEEIHEARKKADIVIVTYHWGVEYRNQPDDRQKELGHLTIDSGADVVIGNHPHWIQPIEFYKGKLITYAHGNFVFDQMWSEETKKGVVGQYIFYDNKLIDVQYFPIYIQDYGQPHFLNGGQKQQVLEDMKQQSLILSKTK